MNRSIDDIVEYAHLCHAGSVVDGTVQVIARRHKRFALVIGRTARRGESLGGCPWVQSAIDKAATLEILLKEPLRHLARRNGQLAIEKCRRLFGELLYVLFQFVCHFGVVQISLKRGSNAYRKILLSKILFSEIIVAIFASNDVLYIIENTFEAGACTCKSSEVFLAF